MKMKKFALRGMIVLAAAVALCIFFSGTVRNLTTPKVRFAQARMGKMEVETELKGQVVFPETVEFTLPVPEGMTLTVTRVQAEAGARVKAGDPLLSARVTDGEKTLETLRKDLLTAQKELRELQKKTADIRLNRGEQKWREAWERDAAAAAAAQEARIGLFSALRRAGLEMEGDRLPEGAGEEIETLWQAWRQAEQERTESAGELTALERYAIPESTWTLLQQLKAQEDKTAALEEQLTATQVMIRTAEKITAPRAAYVTEVGVEKGSTVDGDTVVMKMTAEGSQPVIRLSLADVKQEVNPGTTVILESDGWSQPAVQVIQTGLTLEGRPYADAEITQDVLYALGSVSTLMKNEIKAKLVTRSRESTCLLPASAVRGSGKNRYVYVAETDSSAFGGSRMKARKTDVTVLAESGSTVSVAEDLTYQKVLYMEDRALTEGGAVMEYAKDQDK